MKKNSADLELLRILAQSDEIANDLSNKLDKELLKLLVPGNYYLRPNPINRKEAIFGKILVPRNEEDAIALDGNPNLRLVYAYSTRCENGEYGSELVGNMLPISKELFDYARSKGWKISAKDAMQFVILLARAEQGHTPEGQA